MAFKLGQRSEFSKTMNLSAKFNKDTDASVPGTPVFRKKLAKGIMGEANADGSIFISDKIEPGSQEERQVINHEMRHATDMKTGKLGYSDNYVMYNGDKFSCTQHGCSYNYSTDMCQ